MNTIDKQQSPLEILSAAATLFSEQGFAGTSMAAVAKASGHSKALVQYHFATKDNLWRRAVEHVWQQRDAALPRYLDERYLEALDEEAQRQMVRHLCQGLIRFTADNPEWVKIMYREASSPSPRLDWMIDTFFRQDIELGRAMVSLAQSRQLLPQTDPMSLLLILGGTVIHYVNVAPITARISGHDPLSDDAIDRYVDHFIGLLQ